jgi:hypothetical protein
MVVACSLADRLQKPYNLINEFIFYGQTIGFKE